MVRARFHGLDHEGMVKLLSYRANGTEPKEIPEPSPSDWRGRVGQTGRDIAFSAHIEAKEPPNSDRG